MKPALSFGTAVNCMDGRVQEPVIRWLQQTFHVRYVDMITEAGPIKALSSTEAGSVTESIRQRLEISINKHHSQVVAVAGHHDCAGNPLPYSEQVEQIKVGVEQVREWFPAMRVVGLYVNQLWQVELVCE